MVRRNNQLDIEIESLKERILELEDVFSKKAKENQGTRTDIKQISAESKPIETRQELSKVASVSHDTIAKVKKIQEKALDLIYKKTYYRNINTIRKNVQYFFWVSIIGIVSTIIFILLV